MYSLLASRKAVEFCMCAPQEVARHASLRSSTLASQEAEVVQFYNASHCCSQEAIYALLEKQQCLEAIPSSLPPELACAYTVFHTTSRSAVSIWPGLLNLAT